jgi:hypothetical protein
MMSARSFGKYNNRNRKFTYAKASQDKNEGISRRDAKAQELRGAGDQLQSVASVSRFFWFTPYEMLFRM